MEFEKLISIAGQSSLFEILSRTKFGLVAKSLENGKKMPVYQSQQVSSLQDISMYTYEGEVALREVFVRLLKKTEGKPSIKHTEPADALRKAFEEIVPDFDKERVRDSDLKKLFRWFNQAVENGMTDPSTLESTENQEAATNSEEPEKD